VNGKASAQTFTVQFMGEFFDNVEWKPVGSMCGRELYLAAMTKGLFE